MIYKTYKTFPENKDAAIKLNDDGSTVSFLFDPANRDYTEYLEWLSKGNTPEPADE